MTIIIVLGLLFFLLGTIATNVFIISKKLSDIHYVLEESVEDMSDGPEQLDLFNGEY